MQGIDDLRRASEILTRQSNNLQDQVHEAAKAFWAAHLSFTTWPDELQTMCKDVCRHILFHGTIDQTIPRLDDAALEAARDALLEFCARAEEISANGPAAGEEP